MKKDRPELVRMMNNIRAGKIQRVFTESVVRLSRDYIYLCELLREMDSLGCTFFSVTDGVDTGEDRRQKQEEAIHKLIVSF